MRTRPLPSLDYLNESLSYDPTTGVFTWKVRPIHHFKSAWSQKRWNTVFAGTAAGSPHPRGYICIYVGGVSYKAHRLAWYITHGKPPQDQIDHIDGTTSNNKITNLREATYQENNSNARTRINNTSGVKGVSWNSKNKKWVVQLQHRGSKNHFGYFSNFNDAVETATQARINLHGTFARHS